MTLHENRQKKLTDSYVAALMPQIREYTFWDRRIPSFGVRVRATGYKSYVLHIMSESVSQRVTLGAVPHLSCRNARIKAS